MKRIIVITIIALVFFAEFGFAEQAIRKQYIPKQPRVGAVPVPPSNSPPTLDDLYCPVSLDFDDYFTDIYDFMCKQMPASQLEPYWVIDLNTQSWEQDFYFDPNNNYGWWNSLTSQWLIIECLYGKYDSAQYGYPAGLMARPGGFCYNEVVPPYIRGVWINFPPNNSYFLNELQFDQFLLTGHTTVYVEQNNEELNY